MSDDPEHAKYFRADHYARAVIDLAGGNMNHVNATLEMLIKTAFLAGWNSAEEYADYRKHDTGMYDAH